MKTPDGGNDRNLDRGARATEQSEVTRRDVTVLENDDIGDGASTTLLSDVDDDASAATSGAFAFKTQRTFELMGKEETLPEKIRSLQSQVDAKANQNATKIVKAFNRSVKKTGSFVLDLKDRLGDRKDNIVKRVEHIIDSTNGKMKGLVSHSSPPAAVAIGWKTDSQTHPSHDMDSQSEREMIDLTAIHSDSQGNGNHKGNIAVRKIRVDSKHLPKHQHQHKQRRKQAPRKFIPGRETPDLVVLRPKASMEMTPTNAASGANDHQSIIETQATEPTTVTTPTTTNMTKSFSRLSTPRSSSASGRKMDPQQVPKGSLQCRQQQQQKLFSLRSPKTVTISGTSADKTTQQPQQRSPRRPSMRQHLQQGSVQLDGAHAMMMPRSRKPMFSFCSMDCRPDEIDDSLRTKQGMQDLAIKCGLRKTRSRHPSVSPTNGAFCGDENFFHDITMAISSQSTERSYDANMCSRSIDTTVDDSRCQKYRRRRWRESAYDTHDDSYTQGYTDTEVDTDTDTDRESFSKRSLLGVASFLCKSPHSAPDFMPTFVIEPSPTCMTFHVRDDGMEFMPLSHDTSTDSLYSEPTNTFLSHEYGWDFNAGDMSCHNVIDRSERSEASRRSKTRIILEEIPMPAYREAEHEAYSSASSASAISSPPLPSSPRSMGRDEVTKHRTFRSPALALIKRSEVKRADESELGSQVGVELTLETFMDGLHPDLRIGTNQRHVKQRKTKTKPKIKPMGIQPRSSKHTGREQRQQQASQRDHHQHHDDEEQRDDVYERDQGSDFDAPLMRTHEPVMSLSRSESSMSSQQSESDVSPVTGYVSAIAAFISARQQRLEDLTGHTDSSYSMTTATSASGIGSTINTASDVTASDAATSNFGSIATTMTPFPRMRGDVFESSTYDDSEIPSESGAGTSTVTETSAPSTAATVTTDLECDDSNDESLRFSSFSANDQDSTGLVLPLAQETLLSGLAKNLETASPRNDPTIEQRDDHGLNTVRGTNAMTSPSNSDENSFMFISPVSSPRQSPINRLGRHMSMFGGRSGLAFSSTRDEAPLSQLWTAGNEDNVIGASNQQLQQQQRGQHAGTLPSTDGLSKPESLAESREPPNDGILGVDLSNDRTTRQSRQSLRIETNLEERDPTPTSQDANSTGTIHHRLLSPQHLRTPQWDSIFAVPTGSMEGRSGADDDHDSHGKGGDGDNVDEVRCPPLETDGEGRKGITSAFFFSSFRETLNVHVDEDSFSHADDDNDCQRDPPSLSPTSIAVETGTATASRIGNGDVDSQPAAIVEDSDHSSKEGWDREQNRHTFVDQRDDEEDTDEDRANAGQHNHRDANGDDSDDDDNESTGMFPSMMSFRRMEPGGLSPMRSRMNRTVGA